jgi:ABC-type multidrug transport system ATPase subunit
MGEEERIIILSTHIVGDISSTCNDMALLVEGRVGFHGSPGELIKQSEGFVFEIDANATDLISIQEKYAVISTTPSELGWKVQVVAKDTGNYPSKTIDPNLEHAYVHFIDQHYDAEIIPDLQELDFKDD